MTSSEKNGINIRTNASHKWDRTCKSGAVSRLCWQAAPVANVLWKPPGNNIEHGNMIQFGNRLVLILDLVKHLINGGYHCI